MAWLEGLGFTIRNTYREIVCPFTKTLAKSMTITAYALCMDKMYDASILSMGANLVRLFESLYTYTT